MSNTFARHNVSHQTPQELIVWAVLKLEGLTMLKVRKEFTRIITAKLCKRDPFFVTPYPLTPGFLAARLELLPRQFAPKEVQEHVSDRFEIVSPAGLEATMHVEAYVAHCARHSFAFGA